MDTRIVQIENGHGFMGDALVEGYIKVLAPDNVIRHIRLTVDGKLFDAIPGQCQFYSPEPGTPHAKDVWVKSLTDEKTEFEIYVRTFDPPEQGTER